MYHHYPYQPPQNYQGKKETSNESRHPTGVQQPYQVPSSSSQFMRTPFHQQYPADFHHTTDAHEAYHTSREQQNGPKTNDYQYQPIDISSYMKPGMNLKDQVDQIQHLMVRLIEQNNEILRQLQHRPEQNQTVSTPSGGGAVIVRM